ncbi:prepilin-type N-terminal cleavage/methylation domain-containing protein [Alkalibaculum bacchi]|uniref:Prepilin-type N-terminal cleavage/methylation domain-containing protein n=1 Tax=Alkalibaculum bacchi TaxID=645887 RepID=A0A366HX34_9FIRM|nr:prepilin-type N-terminal cleavage/methylation domain-containing protein [Alkalibaculum bacchi]RBP58076.1 prepilin-type N-terminal cleavage/methylation domain-containing protein [Alkalibaculum bacchi]
MNEKSEGFTFIELIIVIGILAIIAIIAVPKLIGYRSLAVERVCETNRDTVARQYEVYIQTKDQGESRFNQFLNENFDEVCSDDGIITYEDCRVKCSIHKSVSDEDEPPGDGVPWL